MFLKLSRDDCFELPCFSEEEGADFLMKRTGLQGGTNRREAISLAKELGALPLALEQAAACICASHGRISFKDYLDHYQEVKMDFLKNNSVTSPGTEEAAHRLSVHSTWNITLDRVEQRSAAAYFLMNIVSLLNAKDIPFCFINPGLPEIAHEEFRKCASSKAGVEGLLNELSSYCLVSVDDKKMSFSMHPLVKQVIRDSNTKLGRAVLQEPAFQLYKFAERDISGRVNMGIIVV